MTLKLNGTNSVAAPAYAGDDADTGLQCGTNELKLVTGGSTRATIKDNGNLGIGFTSPGARVEVKGVGDLSGTAYEYLYATDGSIKVTGNESTVDIVSTDAGNHASSLLLRGVNKGFGLVNDSDNNILSVNSFTASNNSFHIHGTGGNFVSSFKQIVGFKKTGGITFNGDTADANALDDYEEGEWTPAAQHYDGTLTVVSADYVKVGQLVHVNMYVSFSNTTDGSDINITGLPYTVAGDANNHYSLFTAHTNGNLPNFHLRPQGTTNQMLGVYLASGDGDRKPSYTNLANKFIIMGGTYRATP